jgi:hypothetical protein
MFAETASLGKLAVQLCYYRGFNQFYTSDWITTRQQLMAQMLAVQCQGGHTQIIRLLRHVLEAVKSEPLKAVVFIGDCFEEDVTEALRLAGQLRLFSLPLFIFHEGDDGYAQQVFRRMAALSGGACCRFSDRSAADLEALLSAVAVYSVGGLSALRRLERKYSAAVAQLTHQLAGKP